MVTQPLFYLIPQWLNFYCFVRLPVPLLGNLNKAGFQTPAPVRACLCSVHVRRLCNAKASKWWQICLSSSCFPSPATPFVREFHVEDGI